MSSTEIPDGAPVGAGAPQAPSARHVSSGFGNPAEDATVRRIDLNEALIRHPEATFVMRAGETIPGAGIEAGDVLLVDRAVAPVSGNLLVASVEGELVVRRLVVQGKDTRLEAADSSVGDDVVADDSTGFEVWGVVTYVIKSVA